VATQSQNILWTPTCSGRSYSHSRIRRISIDRFYELATGRANAFKELCDAIRIATPRVIKFIKESEDQLASSSMTTNKAHESLVSRAETLGISELDTIFKDNFTGYSGF